MGESPRLTIVYEPGEDGSSVALIPEVASAHGQGRRREQAWVEREQIEAEATHSA
jgi:hypothetical protein